MSAGPIAPLVGPLYGSLYLGTVLSTAFYGVTCMQTFFYYVHYPRDPLHTKILVATLCALNTIHEALCIAGVYKYIIAGLMDPLSILTSFPELIIVYLVTALVSVPTQGFFVYRIYIFSEKNIIAPIIYAVLGLVQIVGITVYVAKALYTANGGVHAVPISALNGGIFATLGILCLSVAAGVDILIAIFLTYLLLRKRSTTGIASTAHILQRLTVFAVNTGIWTATFALLTIILLHLFPSNVLYAVFIYPLCPIYCNTLLANLNVRTYVRGETGYNVGMDLFTNRRSWMSSSTRRDKKRGTEGMVSSVHVTTEMVTFSDASQSQVTAAATERM